MTWAYSRFPVLGTGSLPLLVHNKFYKRLKKPNGCIDILCKIML